MYIFIISVDGVYLHDFQPSFEQFHPVFVQFNIHPLHLLGTLRILKHSILVAICRVDRGARGAVQSGIHMQTGFWQHVRQVSAKSWHRLPQSTFPASSYSCYIETIPGQGQRRTIQHMKTKLQTTATTRTHRGKNYTKKTENTMGKPNVQRYSLTDSSNLSVSP